MDKNNEFIKLSNKLSFGLVDIYFPSIKHRDKWNKNEDLLVAPVNPKEIEDVPTTIAYDKNGEETTLSTKTETEIPVLVVSFSEKRGNYNFIQKIPQNKLAKTTTNYNFNIRGIYVKKNYESWLDGAMEIYVKVKMKIGANGTYGGWSETQLGDLNANSAKYFNPGVNLISSQSEDYYIKIEIWEDDGWGSGNDDFVADEYYDNYRLGNGDTGAWDDWAGPTSEFQYTSQGLWGKDISTYDGVLGSADYDTMWLTKN